MVDLYFGSWEFALELTLRSPKSNFLPRYWDKLPFVPKKRERNEIMYKVKHGSLPHSSNDFVLTLNTKNDVLRSQKRCQLFINSESLQSGPIDRGSSSAGNTHWNGFLFNYKYKAVLVSVFLDTRTGDFRFKNKRNLFLNSRDSVLVMKIFCKYH